MWIPTYLVKECLDLVNCSKNRFIKWQFSILDILLWLEKFWRAIPLAFQEPQQRPRQPPTRRPLTEVAGASLFTIWHRKRKKTSCGNYLAHLVPCKTSKWSATCKPTSAKASGSSPWPTTTSAWSPSSPWTATPSAIASFRSASRPIIGNPKCWWKKKKTKIVTWEKVKVNNVKHE